MKRFLIAALLLFPGLMVKAHPQCSPEGGNTIRNAWIQKRAYTSKAYSITA